MTIIPFYPQMNKGSEQLLKQVSWKALKRSELTVQMTSSVCEGITFVTLKILGKIILTAQQSTTVI